MKNFKYLLFLFLCGSLFFTACKNDILEEEPTNVLVASQFYQTATDAETALVGAYNSIQRVYDLTGFPLYFGSKGTDILNSPGWEGIRNQIHRYLLTSNMAPIEFLWRDAYASINTINGVIDGVGSMSEEILDAERKTEIIAEAKFLRALVYFGIVKTWENVPLVLEETKDLNNINVAQAPTADVYAAIIADLQEAESVLAEGQGRGRATQGAATALLGKVYLQMTGFPLNQSDKNALAIDQFEKIISSGTYRLLPAYNAVFDLENEDNDEIIFAAKFDGPGFSDGGNVANYHGPVGQQANGGGWGTEYINLEFVDSFDPNDDRLCHNIAKHSANNCETNSCEDATCLLGNCNWRPWKWHKPKPNTFTNDSPYDLPLIRYSDILLSYAEALNNLESGPSDVAYDAVKQVTSRSNAPEFDAGLNAEAFAAALLSERRRELCFEGHRKSDLIRFGKFMETIMAIDETCWSNGGNPGPNLEAHEIRFPIPQREIDLNPNLKQNDGY